MQGIDELLRPKLSPDNQFELVDMDGEIWESIAEFDGYYEVSNLGRVKSLPRLVRCGRGGAGEYITRPRILRPAVNKKDSALQYLYVNLCIDRRTFTREVHLLVGRTFLPTPTPDKKFLTHKNHNTLDNRAVNLEFVTPSEKSKKAYRDGNAKNVLVGKYGGDGFNARPVYLCDAFGKSTTMFPSRIDAAKFLVDSGIASSDISLNHILSAIAKAAKRGTTSYGFKWSEQPSP